MDRALSQLMCAFAAVSPHLDALIAHRAGHDGAVLLDILTNMIAGLPLWVVLVILALWFGPRCGQRWLAFGRDLDDYLSNRRVPRSIRSLASARSGRHLSESGGTRRRSVANSDRYPVTIRQSHHRVGGGSDPPW